MTEATTTPEPSVSMQNDSLFSDELPASPLSPRSGNDESTPIEELLPLSQRMSSVMVAAHAAVDEKLGAELATLTLAELQALQTRVTIREKQLLTTSDTETLFAEMPPLRKGAKDHVSTTALSPTASDSPRSDSFESTRYVETPATPSGGKLSQLEYAQVRQENAHLAEVVCVRATADLVKSLRHPDFALEIPGRQQGKTPLTAATSFVASALRLTYSTVDKRVSAAATMWPAMEYRRASVVAPHLAEQLERGRIPFDSAIAAQNKLTSIRQAVRRAGGSTESADDMVQHKEREFVRHALRNNPHTFSRFAKSQSDAVTNTLIGPQQSLTPEQVKHEKGLFYDGPIGDSLHRLTLVVDEAELLQLTAIREFATKLNSVTSKLRAQAYRDQADNAQRDSSSFEDNENSADEPRLTPQDVELGIQRLFDGQTKAERWLNTLFDFTSAGLILHKTYDPHATNEEQRRRDKALQKAAAHSTVLTDILGVDDPSKETEQHTDATPNDQHKTSRDLVDSLVPPGYQLLRPNLDLIVEMSLQDLLGSPPEASGMEERLSRLKRDDRSITVPIGSPSNTRIDYGLARQQACHQRVIPMVLGSASQPLDVGRAQRSFTSAMRRAMHVRDRGCVVPGCPRPAPWCEPHHLEEWAKGGPTSVENGALLCRQHHTAVHKGLLEVHMEADGRPSCSLSLAQDPTQTRYRNIFWRAA